MKTHAVVLNAPEQLALSTLALTPMAAGECVVDIAFSGISTGTERLLYSGRMPAFPGMGYPLVPGYESVGRVREAGPDSGRTVGEHVFVPGAPLLRRSARPVRRRGVARRRRRQPPRHGVGDARRTFGSLLALAATARHAIAAPGAALPDLIVGHGTLGAPSRSPHGAGRRHAYRVGAPGKPCDRRRRLRYRPIRTMMGGATTASFATPAAMPAFSTRSSGRLAPGGEIVLAGFYSEALSFAFPPAFMREARLRIAAQWQHEDLVAVQGSSPNQRALSRSTA